MGNSIKIDMDIIDEMSEKDKREFIHHGYHRCDIFIYRGQTCFSSRFIEYILENLQNKTDNKELIENLEEAVQYGSGGIGYQHLRLNTDAITNKAYQEVNTKQCNNEEWLERLENGVYGEDDRNTEHTKRMKKIMKEEEEEFLKELKERNQNDK